MAKKPSLDDWLASNARPRSSFWNDALNDDLREQILASPASSAEVVRWLKSLGYDGTDLPEATDQKIDAARRRERERRARAADPE